MGDPMWEKITFEKNVKAKILPEKWCLAESVIKGNQEHGFFTT